jgi:hypothetical protein
MLLRKMSDAYLNRQLAQLLASAETFAQKYEKLPLN